MTYTVISHCYEDTFAIGRSFGPYCEDGLIFMLDGDLAAGENGFCQRIRGWLGRQRNDQKPFLYFDVQL